MYIYTHITIYIGAALRLRHVRAVLLADGVGHARAAHRRRLDVVRRRDAGCTCNNTVLFTFTHTHTSHRFDHSVHGKRFNLIKLEAALCCYILRNAR